MAQTPVQYASIIESVFERGLKARANTQTLAANITLDKDANPLQFLDPGGAARNVTLPAEANSDGLIFIIVNTADAAENLVVKDDGAATIATIGQNEIGIMFCNGTVWKGMVGANA